LIWQININKLCKNNNATTVGEFGLLLQWALTVQDSRICKWLGPLLNKKCSCMQLATFYNMCQWPPHIYVIR